MEKCWQRENNFPPYNKHERKIAKAMVRNSKLRSEYLPSDTLIAPLPINDSLETLAIICTLRRCSKNVTWHVLVTQIKQSDGSNDENFKKHQNLNL